MAQKDPWVKGIQICSNGGTHSSSKDNNNDKTSENSLTKFKISPERFDQFQEMLTLHKEFLGEENLSFYKLRTIY